MAALLGVVGTVLVFLAICGAIYKVPSLLLPSSSEETQDLFTFTVAIILTVVVVTTPWDTFFFVAGYLLKTVCSMLLLFLLFVAIFSVVKAFVPSAMQEQYQEFAIVFISYTLAMILYKVLRMPSNSILEIVCLLIFWLLLLGSMATVVEELVPSAMEDYHGFTTAVLVALTVLGTRILWTIISWSTPAEKPTALTTPSASTLSTLDSQMNTIFTAIQEMKVQNKRDVGMILALMAWMIKIPIFVFIILIAAIAWMIKFIKENADEIINTCVSKVTAFAKDSLGWRWPGYRRLFRVFVGPPGRVGQAARQVFS